MLLRTLQSSNKQTEKSQASVCLLHSELSWEVVPTMKSAEGSLLELSFLCLALRRVLDFLWSPLLLLLVSWVFSSLWGIWLIGTLLFVFPSDSTLLTFVFFCLAAFGLASGDFAGSCCDFFSWGVISVCGWIMGGLIWGTTFTRAAPLLMTTSVRQLSSVCSFAKLINTCKNEAVVWRWSHFSAQMYQWSALRIITSSLLYCWTQIKVVSHCDCSKQAGDSKLREVCEKIVKHSVEVSLK